ncbi:glycerophosphodiester phosphodiesterase GDPDL4-like [Iris pallida]|uniref:glycerophosphodiester phosphodiesterase n=1 Tax=Iris pallida TaxID=29817 RepID=A0AAX6FR81_IRIPA|nr:glycerophosphodiester phosphodiesterase GDPDL4-like [Iris pallida]
MWEKSSMLMKLSCFLVLFLVVHLQEVLLVTAQNSKASPWQTLSGDVPTIIARGGFSGLFPDSSPLAYEFALVASSPGTTLWCDVQLSKDGIGFCLPDIKLDNCTTISSLFPDDKKDYLVNGVSTSGWFSVDYDSTTLSQNVSLIQGIYSRTYRFDGTMFPLAVEDVPSLGKTLPAFWLNIQHDIFYSQHNLSMKDYVLSVSKRVAFDYLSSPEVGFLSGIALSFKKTKTKLVFRFLGEDLLEPSTNQTYGSLAKNLTFIKTFAAGILVPKHYIWPVTSDLYLQPHTSIVTDAHKEGLEVYAGDFANDAPISYNYSYSPLAEQLSFIDNGVFSVDGVVTDFPITPSEAIGCFSHINRSTTDHGKPIIISHCGASGDYPECTDLAYQKAVDDGADIIDCPVQVTSDGVLVCMSSINLMDDTTVMKSSFRSRISLIPDIQGAPGIFTFNLTWEEIKTNLKPLMMNPESNYNLVRNPRYTNAGNFVTLSDFLTFAKGKVCQEY